MRFSPAICLLSVICMTTAAAPPGGDNSVTTMREASTISGASTAIDRAVDQQLGRLGIQPAPLCSDSVFVRRVYLDAIGTLPTAQETRNFLDDASADKRARLIDRLLERDEFPTYWAMKWSDLLRVKSEFPINLWPDAVQGYYTWIHQSLRDEKPFDQFARELICASGSNFYAPEANFYRASQDRTPKGLAAAVALTFMGTRIESLPKQRCDDLAAVFVPLAFKSTSEWKEEIVYCDLAKTGDKELTMPDGTKLRLRAGQDPRGAFSDWLNRKDNPYFSRAIANRVWYWLVGRGIVHEPDDLRPDNPPANPQLLTLLQRELVEHRYNLKQLFRLILNSQTYQRASSDTSPQGQASFASYPVRRLDAEVLIDAICQITGTTEKYSSAIPEPYTFIPESHRSIALPDASINSSFLELFGRSPRDTGQELERANRISAAQRLHLLNSSHIQRKLENGPGLRKVVGTATGTRERAIALYLAILSRYPTDQEISRIEQYARSRVASDREVTIDVAWALINSSEFLYRH